jgi:phospholipase/carboxylesterase
MISNRRALPRRLFERAPWQSSCPVIPSTLDKMLETIEVETAPQPNAAIIWLHGLGADGHDFEPIVPEIVQRRERSWRFVFPNAPMRPVTINNGMRMRAWYDIVGLDRRAAEDAAGFQDSDTKIRELIAREVGRGIAANRIVLAGFSQGGAVSLYTVPRLAEKLAGVMALSCYLPRESAFNAERAPANDATPIFMAHGQQDGTVPMVLGVTSRDYLLERGYAVEWHEYPMAHSVCAQEVADIRQFLFRVLP